MKKSEMLANALRQRSAGVFVKAGPYRINLTDFAYLETLNGQEMLFLIGTPLGAPEAPPEPPAGFPLEPMSFIFKDLEVDFIDE